MTTSAYQGTSPATLADLGRRCMDYHSISPSDLAGATASEIGRPVSYVPVATDGPARATALLAELI